MTKTAMKGHIRMSNTRDATSDPHKSSIYEIRIKGHLDPGWTEWFGGVTIALEDNGETLLTGPIIDQAALHGLLRKVRNLGMPLISVNRTERGQTHCSDVES
jgi:hypothetical protein